MKEIFIASNNAHKISEIKEILIENNLDIKVLCPNDFNDHDEPVEDGFSYEENAYIKAKYYYDKYHYPTLADDSGISIKYFNDLPNIHSSRFLGNMDYKQRNQLIVDIMKDVKDRSAHYSCVMCFISDGQVYYFDGYMYGEIATEVREGPYGFGYDPIFYLKEYGKTNAELKDVKNHIGHRHNALIKWVDFLHEKNI